MLRRPVTGIIEGNWEGVFEFVEERTNFEQILKLIQAGIVRSQRFLHGSLEGSVISHVLFQGCNCAVDGPLSSEFGLSLRTAGLFDNQSIGLVLSLVI